MTLLYHAGLCMTSGLVIITRGGGTGAVLIQEEIDAQERAARLQRATSDIGDPFVSLPGNPPDHKIVGELADGTKLPVRAVEMAYNDAMTIDKACGEGAYERLMPPLEVEVLRAARRIYQERSS